MIRERLWELMDGAGTMGYSISEIKLACSGFPADEVMNVLNKSRWKHFFTICDGKY